MAKVKDEMKSNDFNNTLERLDRVLEIIREAPEAQDQDDSMDGQPTMINSEQTINIPLASLNTSDVASGCGVAA